MFAIDSPAGRMANLNVPPVDERLQIEIDDATVWVDDGTVYNVVSVVADGATWPSTLYVVGMVYIPESTNGWNCAAVLAVAIA